MLNGTVPPCQIAAWTRLRHSLARFEMGFVFGLKTESKQEFLALIKLEKNVKRKREERNEVH